jgi:streptomycin 6-kinase
VVLRVPPVVAKKARVVGAEKWLDDLPEVVAQLSDRWGFSVGRAYDDATEAFVCPVTMLDETLAVLKLMIPRPTNDYANEVTVLRLAEGSGCVRLLDEDADHHAMLLERLGPTLQSLGLPLEQRLVAMCETVRPLWLRAPDRALPSGAQKARWLMDFITTTWENLGHPCSERVVDHALECARRRETAHRTERGVLVHGDVHQWNTLKATSGFKLIDPDGLLAEAEYDLGVMMREDPEELMNGDPFERARSLARRCNLNARAVWEWGVVERVSTGLLATMVELQPAGRTMLSAAEHVAVLDVTR